MDGYGNLYPDSDGYVGYDEKQQQRSDILKLILYDLNSAICPRDIRLLAIQAALEEFDHNDEALHDEELELRADHILLQKLTFAMSINPSSDEVGYITSALEAVYRGGRTRLAQSFHEICDALMPLFVEMIRPPAGWSPQILQQLTTANQTTLANDDNLLLQQQNENESLKGGDERSIATKSLGGTSQRSRDPSIVLQFQKSDPSFAPQTYYGDYDEESAESVQIPSGTGEYFEQMERMNSTGSGIPSTAPGGGGGGGGMMNEEENESPGVGFPPPSEYFDEMNRRSSTGEASRDSTGNNAALVIDKRLSSFGVSEDSTGNEQALVLQSFGGEGQIVASGGGGGGNVDTIRNDLDDAQAVLNRMDTTGTGGDANENSLRSSSNSHDSYAAFLQQEKEKMAAASAEDEDSFDSRCSPGDESPPQIDDFESANQPPVVAPYDSEEDMVEEPPVVAPYDSEDEGMGEDQPPVVAPFDDSDQPPVVAPFDDSEEEGMGNTEHDDHIYEGEDGGDEAMPLRGGGGDIDDGEVEDVTNEYAQDNPFADMAGLDNPFADIAGLSASVFNQGMTGGRAGSMAFSEQSSQHFDDQGGYSGAAPAIFPGYDDDASKIGMGGDQSQVSYRSGGPQDQEGGDSFAPGFEGINRHKFESEQPQKNFNRKSSELSGVSGISEDHNMRRLSAVTDEWGGMDPGDRDQSMMGFPPPNNSKQQQFDPIMESMSQFKIGGDDETEAEEKYSDFPYEGGDDGGGGDAIPSLANGSVGQQEQDLDDIFQFQEPRLSMTSEQDYFNYSDPVEGEVCSLAVRKVIKILRYFSRVLSAMEPLAQQTGLVDALLYHMTKKPLSTDYDDEIASRVDAIAVVVNLACAEENKIMLVYHPGLLDAVINIANHDPIDEAREHAAIVLMNLVSVVLSRIYLIAKHSLSV